MPQLHALGILDYVWKMRGGPVRKLSLLAVVALVVVVWNAQTIALAEQNAATTLPDGWKQLDADYFTIYAPPTWKFRKLQGIDSYVGEFVGDGVKLEFDYGQYSNALTDEKEPTYVVIEEKVGGRLARMVSPRVPGHGVTGIYFQDVGDANGLNIAGLNLSDAQQKTVLTIFRTIRFRPLLPKSLSQYPLPGFDRT